MLGGSIGSGGVGTSGGSAGGVTSMYRGGGGGKDGVVRAILSAVGQTMARPLFHLARQVAIVLSAYMQRFRWRRASFPLLTGVTNPLMRERKALDRPRQPLVKNGLSQKTRRPTPAGRWGSWFREPLTECHVRACNFSPSRTAAQLARESRACN